MVLVAIRRRKGGIEATEERCEILETEYSYCWCVCVRDCVSEWARRVGGVVRAARASKNGNQDTDSHSSFRALNNTHTHTHTRLPAADKKSSKLYIIPIYVFIIVHII